MHEATPASTAMLEIDLEPESETASPAGAPLTPGGVRRALVGWLQLASLIEDWRPDPRARTPTTRQETMMRISVPTPPRAAGAVATLAAATLLATAPAQAAGRTSAACASQFTTTISPGFSPVPSSGTQTTNGETGTVACIGKINGRRITGPGSIGYDSTYEGGTCASETASGTVRATIPTATGDQHLVGALTVQRTALIVRAQVRFGGIHYRGVGAAIPMQGNCLTTPLRQALIVLTGTLSSK